MARKKFLHELPECQILIEQISRAKGIREQLVEKDYWLMHSLWGLKAQGFKFDLKGGTSLSKGFQIIDRFSEDIDIRIEPPEFLGVKIGKNQDKPDQIRSRVQFYDWLSKEISISGISTERDKAFDDEKGRNGGIRLNYKSPFLELEGLKRFVLLEVGFDVTTPNKECMISSWLFDAALEVGLDIEDNRARNVTCYLPGYTLVEKLQAISTRHRKAQVGKLLPSNFIRHYYDVYQLLGNEAVLDFIGSEDYFAHKMSRFRDADGPDITKNQAFILDNSKIREEYAKEYRRTQALYYGKTPSFDEIIARIRSFAQRL